MKRIVNKSSWGKHAHTHTRTREEMTHAQNSNIGLKYCKKMGHSSELLGYPFILQIIPFLAKVKFKRLRSTI